MPVLVSQLAEFIQRIPAYISRLQFIVTDFDPSWLSRTLGVEPSGLREGLSGLLTQAAGFLTGLFQSAWNSGRALLDIAGLFRDHACGCLLHAARLGPHGGGASTA